VPGCWYGSHKKSTHIWYYAVYGYLCPVGGVLDGMGTYTRFERAKDGAVPYKTVERGAIQRYTVSCGYMVLYRYWQRLYSTGLYYTAVRRILLC